MAKRIKKPLVRPEKQREWLRRHEIGGESPMEIAKSDKYDVRTVRKYIELERQERERREARSIVLRQALEEHYRDLCNFAQQLDSEASTDVDQLIDRPINVDDFSTVMIGPGEEREKPDNLDIDAAQVNQTTYQTSLLRDVW